MSPTIGRVRTSTLPRQSPRMGPRCTGAAHRGRPGPLVDRSTLAAGIVQAPNELRHGDRVRLDPTARRERRSSRATRLRGSRSQRNERGAVLAHRAAHCTSSSRRARGTASAACSQATKLSGEARSSAERRHLQTRHTSFWYPPASGTSGSWAQSRTLPVTHRESEDSLARVAVTAEVIPENSNPVLDHGFVRLDNAMASDLSVVNGARVSFARHKQEMDDSDAGLIRFLMRERHGTPYEHNAFRFHATAQSSSRPGMVPDVTGEELPHGGQRRHLRRRRTRVSACAAYRPEDDR